MRRGAGGDAGPARVRLLHVVRLPLSLAVAVAVAGSAQAADAIPAAGRAVDWRLVEAGREPRTLDLVAFGSSSCLRGQVTASAELQARRVVITVVTTTDAEICTDDYARIPLTVALPAPLRGRAVVGPGRLARDPHAGPAPVPAPAAKVRVPRATDLSRRDAVAAVRDRGLRVRVVTVADLRGLPRVVGQRPASGRAVAPGSTVSLYLSR